MRTARTSSDSRSGKVFAFLFVAAFLCHAAIAGMRTAKTVWWRLNRNTGMRSSIPSWREQRLAFPAVVTQIKAQTTPGALLVVEGPRILALELMYYTFPRRVIHASRSIPPTETASHRIEIEDQDRNWTFIME
jgi:hypothetical protein